MSELLEPGAVRDAGGKLKAWLRKRRLRNAALSVMVESFEPGRGYTQDEVTHVLAHEHSFADPAVLRRSLIGLGLMARTDGRFAVLENVGGKGS